MKTNAEELRVGDKIKWKGDTVRITKLNLDGKKAKITVKQGGKTSTVEVEYDDEIEMVSEGILRLISEKETK